MKRPLRIAVFVGSFPVVSETFILRQITGLLDLGHEVDIYADTCAEAGAAVQPEIERYQLMKRTTFMDMPPEVAPWEMPVWPLTGETWLPGATTAIPNWRRGVRALPKFARCFLSQPRLTRQVLSRAEFDYQAASLSALYRLAKLRVVSRRYDVLHTHFGPVGNSFRFARELWRAPLLVSFHGYDFTTVPRQQGPAVYKKLFFNADLVTVNSDYMGKKLQPLGCSPDKIRKLSYGIDLQKYPFRPRTLAGDEPVRIVTIGRLVEKKGIEYVIRALAQVVRRHPHLRYDVIGDGPLRGQLQQLAREQSVGGIVQFHGALNGDAIRALLDQAHLFVLASVTAQDGDQEGTPVSLLEAQAAGLPVISTQHSGIPEIVLDGESGWLVPERDADALAERLNRLMEHPERWASFGSRGRNFVEARFTTFKCMNALLDIYAELGKKYSARSSTIGM
jgi:colanic acid/amylovoran biosynthesis glycosyltransferase